MHRLVLPRYFAAPILFYLLARRLLNKRRASTHGNTEDPNPGAPSPSIPPIGSHYDVSEDPKPGSPSPSTEPIRILYKVLEDPKPWPPSPSIPPICSHYDVFLSFKGTDTRRAFTDVLYDNLVDAGVLVFRDDYELRIGEKLSTELQEAIENRSAQKSQFHSTGLESEKVANGSEGESVKLVVQEVLKELKTGVMLSYVMENLVGIDSHVEEVMELVNKNSGATLCMGIYGIGGIGKTTLAKVIYNKLSALFVHRSFIADIRESCIRKGLKNLPSQMSKLEQLKELLLDQTMIQEIPSSIGSLKNLETLSANDCKLLCRLLRLDRPFGEFVDPCLVGLCRACGTSRQHGVTCEFAMLVIGTLPPIEKDPLLNYEVEIVDSTRLTWMFVSGRAAASNG
ncbi:hypothetical protein NL676_020910 [Syzygium grande]|nr:hypothetical protein NL676_020910 [Syzygium grande]